MKRLLAILLLASPLSGTALADVWKWVDAQGNTHFVETDTPIYMWVDRFGKVHYSDTPDHEDAVSVELVWHSEGMLGDLENEGGGKESAGDDSDDEAATAKMKNSRMPASRPKSAQPGNRLKTITASERPRYTSRT